MRIPSLRRGALAALTTAALAALGLQVPLAATASAAPTATKSHTDVVHSCGTAKPGAFSCFALRRTDVSAKKGVQPFATTPAGFGPGDLQSAYALPADGGAGQTVAIVDAYDDPNAAADLAVYRDQFGLPACTVDSGCFTKVSQRGNTDDLPSPDSGWAGEISLDIDMVSAVAPNAHILLVEADSANFEDLGAAVDEAVALGAKYVSNSYGTGYDSSPGSGEDPSELTSMDPYYNHPGVAVVASSGDGDYGVSYPAASQYVTSVGGTALAKDTGTTRGWSESVWHNAYGGPGSGCSVYEPKPAFQTDTACANRTVADVSAVADPETGVSVYQTYGGGGWSVYGGTSASSPIIAGVYASAGTPAADTYPNAYPYAQTGALNDVTSGNNGSCSPAALCTAGAGYDGPTGLGTPNGLDAFRSGPHGVITGKVTDHATGDPISGATVKAGDHSATSGADGTYKLDIPPGSYDLTAAAYGYSTGSASSVQLDDGGTVTQSFALDAVPQQTVSGKVTDGSGHGWPLYAKITAAGVPGGPVFTDPTTGDFSLTLPQNSSYTLHITADYPGYKAVDKTVTVGTSDLTANVSVPVDPSSTDAPGYSVSLSGSTEPFTSTDGPPDGWTVTKADGTVGGWSFANEGGRTNATGGDGNFAIVDSDHLGQANSQDTSLVSPPQDFSTATGPLLAFDTDYKSYSNSVADVDVTTDGGSTWSNVWHKTTTAANGHIEVSLADYAGKSGVQVRFHYTGSWAYWWELDNVFIGQRSYDPVAGGIVVGNVTDANTGSGVNGATVTSGDAPDDHTTTVATPDDPNVGDGFYWLFSHKTGKHPLTAAASDYTSATATANVPSNGSVDRDLTLKAGQLSVTPASIAKTAAWGASATQKVTVKNTGSAPATVTLGETPGGATVQAAGAPLNLIKGDYSPLALAKHSGSAAKPGADKAGAGKTTDSAKATAAQGAAGDAWQPVPDLPVATGDNTVDAWQGTVYSAFGFTGAADTSDLYAYSADSGAWTKLAPAADTRESPAHGIIDGKLYAAGGWGPTGDPDAKLEIYDIASNTWSTGANSPKPYAGSGTAVLDGKLYSVGGCTATACGESDVTVYDPSSDSWSTAASYPIPVSWESCGGIAGKLYCSGGTTDAGSISSAYVYDPATDSWSPIADQPTDAWGSSYAAANGLLLVEGGAVNDSAALTNQTWAYDPSADSWTALPNANSSLYRGGGSAGFYAVGGLVGSTPDGTAEVLPGYDQTGSSDVTWLSESTDTLTVAPGASANLTVTLDASAPEITQPGVYTASLSLTTDTPYRLAPIGVAFTVKPPATWGKIAGTVTASGGGPLAGATVQIDTWATHYTLKTAKDGTYALWLDVRNNPLQLIVAKDGYQPTVTTVKIKKGATTTADFALLKD
ncbi:carboxypeptidase regulatory-like domain-containing protein, partial [Actinacidiphila sp. bgisy145]|uniref:carboxypeptidase regulatory-like domain-containing protein n=1 Tax=Actinacidiphila sp. bgisy145 TaxID=3413792 RepID=UPI003EBDA07D